jgi:hypothetical protein
LDLAVKITEDFLKDKIETLEARATRRDWTFAMSQKDDILGDDASNADHGRKDTGSTPRQQLQSEGKLKQQKKQEKKKGKKEEKEAKKSGKDKEKTNGGYECPGDVLFYPLS